MDSLPAQRYSGQVLMPLAVYSAALALGLPVTVAMLEPIGFRKDGTPIYPIGGGDAAAPAEITPEQLAAHPAVQKLLAETAARAAEAAVRALNQPDPNAIPGGASPAGNRRIESGAPSFPTVFSDTMTTLALPR